TPGLVRRLLAEASGEQDQLPLVQHLLMRLWDSTAPDADGVRLLNETGYDALGGLQQALNDHAEEALAELTEPGQPAIAETLFRALTERADGEHDTRRPVRIAEVADLAGATPDQVIACAAPFRRLDRSLLMPPPEQLLGADDQLDITHEALIRQWTRLQAWTHEEAARADLYRRLESAAQRWKEGIGALWIEPDLGIALTWRDQQHPTVLWAARYGGDFSLAMRFLEAGRQARDEARAAEDRRRRAEVRRARRVAAASLGALAITLALAGWAWIERQGAEAEKHARTESLFESKLTHAALLAQGEDYAGAWRTLGETVALDRDGIDPKRGQVRNLLAGLVDLRRGAADLVYTGADAGLIDLALSPDRRWLVAGGERGTLVVFDAATGALVRRLEGHDPAAGGLGSVSAVCFNAGGGRLYSGGDDGRIIAWSVPDWQEVSRWQAPAMVRSLALSADGTRLASAGVDNGITLWSTKTGDKLRTLKGETSNTADGSALAWLPDGRLVSGGFEGLVGIWDTKTGKEQVLARVHTDAVSAVAVSPDGTRMATGSGDTVIVWDSKGLPLNRLRGHRNRILGLSFDPTGQRLLSASYDNDLRSWDLASGTTLRVFQGHTAGLWSVAVADGFAYTAANDGTLRRWPLNGAGQWVWDLPGVEPASVALDSDAGLALLGLASGGLRAYGLPGSRPAAASGGPQPAGTAAPPADPYRPGPLLTEVADAHAAKIKRIALSPDHRTIATAGMDGLARLWRPERTAEGLTLTPLHRLEGHKDVVHAVAFSPNGRQVATAGYDGQVGLFETATGAGSLSRAAEAGQVASVAFTPDGTRLVSAQGVDRTLRLWPLDGPRLGAGRIIARLFSDLPTWAALSPYGREAAAVGRQAVVTRHPLDPPADGSAPPEPRPLVGHEQTVFRAIYTPNGQALATVGGEMTLRLWDLTTGQSLFRLQLPDLAQSAGPWDFDLSCTADQIACWIAVPLTMGRLALYRLPYANPPPGLAPPP
ncbi:WD40 repeat domain-containing protein, partial [uncultured Thiodictyon sp.]